MKPQLHGTNNVRCAFVIDKPLTIIGDNTIIELDSECESQSVFIVKSSNVSFQGIHFRDANPVDFPEMPEEGVNILHSYAISMGSFVDAKTDIDLNGTDWLGDNDVCYKNIQIKNCSFEKFFYAIFFRFTPDYLWDNVNSKEKIEHSLIENISILDCKFLGRELLAEYGKDVDNNAGINISGGIPSKYQFINNLKIRGCTVVHASNAAGIGITSVSNFSVLGCSLEDCDQVGIEVENSGIHSNGII